MLTKPTSGWASEMEWGWVIDMLTHNKMVQPDNGKK
jgi:hypothetical protein